MNGFKISIIIPVYNAVSTFESTLLSVLNQSYSNIEIIVVDGNSTDGTKKIFRAYKNRIDVLIEEQDDGVYDAMNKGIAHASGDFYYFLGADDVLDKQDVISKIFEENIDESVKIVFGNVRNVGARTKKIPEVHHAIFSNKLKWKNTLHHQGTFYHQTIFVRFRYDKSLQVLADYELNIRLLKEKAAFKSVPIIVANCSAQGLSKNFNAQLYKEELILKKRNFSNIEYLIQVPWVWFKYLYKNIG